MNKLSQAELEIMNIIWHNEQPITVSAIIGLMPDAKSRKYTTIATFVNRLKDKGFLTSRKSGTVNEYLAAVSEDEFRRAEAKNFVDSVYNGSSKGLIAALCSDKLSDDDFNELMEWIEGKNI